MNIEASGVPAFGSKIHNLCTLLHGEESCQLDTLSGVVGNTTIAHLNQNILGLYTYFLPYITFVKAIAHDASQNEEDKEIEKLDTNMIIILCLVYMWMSSLEKRQIKNCFYGITLNILNSMPNGWIRQEYVQGFYLLIY